METTLVAPFAGTVVAVAGDRVSAGSPVIVIEAMKMEHEVVAERDAVVSLSVAVGDSVSEGDAVVILESMKMEMPVEAEDPGVVSEIRCSEGQSVSEGDVLVVLDD